MIVSIILAAIIGGAIWYSKRETIEVPTLTQNPPIAVTEETNTPTSSFSSLSK